MLSYDGAGRLKECWYWNADDGDPTRTFKIGFRHYRFHILELYYYPSVKQGIALAMNKGRLWWLYFIVKAPVSSIDDVLQAIWWDIFLEDYGAPEGGSET